MSKHTPGPWSVGGEYGTRVVLADGTVVADMWNIPSGDGVDQGRANADLMAAAPDLLEACKTALYGGGTIAEAAEKCRAAIAKAEGEE